MRLSDATMSVKQIFITTFLLLGVAWTTPACAFPSSGDNGRASRDDSAIARAFKEKKRNVQVEGEGVVERILADDLAGAGISVSSSASDRARRSLLHTTSTLHHESPDYRKATVLRFTASTFGIRRAESFTGRITILREDMSQVG